MTRAREEDAKRLVDALRAAGASFSLNDGKLSLSAPPGVVSPEVAADIRTLKAEIIAALAEDAGEIAIVDRSGALPLGVVQERMWAHAALEPDSLIYNLPAAWRFVGPFDERAFAAAFGDFIDRHEIMRTRISTSGGAPTQRFAPPSERPLEIEDLTAIADRPARDARLAERLEELRAFPFDLEKDAPYVARLFRLGMEEHALFFMPHHLIWDGWCFDIFLRDLRELYLARLEGRDARLPALAIQYADYALWHRRRTERGAWNTDIAFWESRLASPPSPPSLPEDRARPQLFSTDGDWTGFAIEEAALARVKEVGARARATTFMTFLAIWRAFLTRLSGDPDIVIGAPIQARQHTDIGDVVGCFVNTIFLRQQLSPEVSIERALAETRRVCLEAYAHQEAPVELLVDRLVRNRDPSRTPLAQVMFSHQQISRRPDDFGAARIEQIHVNPRTSPTDLMFAVMERETTARAVLHYASGPYSDEQAKNLMTSFEAFFRDAIARPDAAIADLALMSEGARSAILQELSAPSPELDLSRRAHEMFAECAAAAPEKIAVATSFSKTTYAELERRAGALAFWLRSLGVWPGDIVALMPPRSADMPALALAVWKCGAAYLPLDPAYPEERLKYMVEDSGARLVVSSSEIAALADSPAPRFDLDSCKDEIAAAPEGVEFAPDRAKSERAYVIYTSGSTGKPKGVENSHRALSNFLQSIVRSPGVQAEDRLLAVTTLAFDISILELFAPLAAGASLAIATADEAGDGEILAALIRDTGATIMQATPSTWRLLLEAGWQGAANLTALCGGEPLPPHLAEALIPKSRALWNMYGPTETTVWSTCRKIERADAISIGGPIANTNLYVVGAGGALMPPGAPGELLIGGEGVAIGYLNRPELTSERFIADPFRAGARLYRTGDLARVLANGEIEHLGRIDAQVKLRGFRIELGEIEAQLDLHEAVARAVVAVKTDAAGEPMLVAYVQYAPGLSATGSELRRYLRRTLPNYMLPQLFLEIDKVPLTGSGKVDRKALPDPVARATARAAKIAPRTPAEREIAEIWSEILSLADISITDNFFELGGQSLQAAQMAARVKERTGQRIAPRAVIFETLEQLAAGAEPLAASR